MARGLIERGSVVVCVVPGDYGKPRPAVVVQSNLFNETHASVSVCPLTSELVEAPLFRLRLKPTRGNGLEKASDVMIDKVTSIRRERIDRTIGLLPRTEMHRVDDALALWLGFEG